MPTTHDTAALPLAPVERGLRESVAGSARQERLQWLLDGPGFTSLLLPLVDLTALVLAVLVAAATGRHHWTLALMPAIALTLFALRGLYRRRLRTLVLDHVVRVVGAVSIATMAVVLVDTYLVGRTTAGAVLAAVWAGSLAGVAASRGLLALAQRWARARGLVGRGTLIVGAGHVGRQIARRLVTHPEYGLRPLGFVDGLRNEVGPRDGRRLPVLGSLEELADVARDTGARHVIVAFSAVRDDTLVHALRECEKLGLEVSLVPRMFESVNDRLEYDTLGGLPVHGLRGVDPQSWQFTVKHAFDRVAAALMLVALAPLMLFIAILVRLESPGPVLFRQRRVGRDGTVFDLLKFRSMRMGDRESAAADSAIVRPPEGQAPGGVEGEDRRTRIGAFIRRTSLDELPQLFNVLGGEMSLVGPRPERPEFVELFGRDIARYGDRHRVKSGLTGWAQVHGLRGQTSLADRVEWDNFYIAHWSLGLDFKILLLTLKAVLRAVE